MERAEREKNALRGSTWTPSAKRISMCFVCLKRISGLGSQTLNPQPSTPPATQKAYSLKSTPQSSYHKPQREVPAVGLERFAAAAKVVSKSCFKKRSGCKNCFENCFENYLATNVDFANLVLLPRPPSPRTARFVLVSNNVFIKKFQKVNSHTKPSTYFFN